MNYILHKVTELVDAWAGKDPVRPDLGIEFKTAKGREVFGIKNEGEEYAAFMCVARTYKVPSSIEELEEFTSEDGQFAIPYSVWSHKKGAGREIVKKVVDLASRTAGVHRVVTLSPQTSMAKRFHLRNNAIELRVNDSTVNFEYPVQSIQ